MPTNSPHVPVDLEDPFEMVEQPQPPPLRPPVSVASVPGKLKDWYSQSSFKQISFATLSFLTLGINTSLMFTGIVSSEAGLGVISTLLAMNLPSPYDSKKAKKLIEATA